MPRRSPYPAELRDRAVRTVGEHRSEYTSEWAAIVSIAAKLNVHRETLRAWTRQGQRRHSSCF